MGSGSLSKSKRGAPRQLRRALHRIRARGFAGAFQEAVPRYRCLLDLSPSSQRIKRALPPPNSDVNVDSKARATSANVRSNSSAMVRSSSVISARRASVAERTSSSCWRRNPYRSASRSYCSMASSPATPMRRSRSRSLLMSRSIRGRSSTPAASARLKISSTRSVSRSRTARSMVRSSSSRRRAASSDR